MAPGKDHPGCSINSGGDGTRMKVRNPFRRPCSGPSEREWILVLGWQERWRKESFIKNWQGLVMNSTGGEGKKRVHRC